MKPSDHARELGKIAGEIAHFRSREPILETARKMSPDPYDPRLYPTLILTRADMLP